MSQSQVAQIESLMTNLSLEEQLILFERMARQLRYSIGQAKTPANLYGIWRDHFPADFDVDAALAEIRHDWESQELNS